MSDDRDEALGRALRALEVPEHRDGFFDELEAKLAAEWTMPARSRRTRWPAPSRWVAAAAIAAVVVSAVVVGRESASRERASEVRAAGVPSTVRAPSLPATATVQVVSGTVERRQARRAPERFRFALTADGRFRWVAADGTSAMAADRATGSTANVFDDGGAGVTVETSGEALGGPDGGAAGLADTALRRDLGWTVRALADAGDPRIQLDEWQGRPAWRLAYQQRTAPDLPERGRDVEVVVDQQTALPVRVVERTGTTVVSSYEVLTLDVSAGPAADDLGLDVPARAGRRTERGPWRRTTLAGLKRAGLWLDAFVPAAVPEGYVADAVAYSTEGLPTGAEGTNPPAAPVVAISYARGLDQLVVTTRPLVGTLDAWEDPFGVELVRVTPAPVQGGYPGGVVVEPGAVPHLWAVVDGKVVTVSGAASARELVAVFRSAVGG